MAEQLLANLKIKPIPKQEKKIQIELEKPEKPKSDKPVDINVQITDKTKTSNIDRKTLLDSIRSGIDVTVKRPIDTTKFVRKSESIEKKIIQEPVTESEQTEVQEKEEEKEEGQEEEKTFKIIKKKKKVTLSTVDKEIEPLKTKRTTVKAEETPITGPSSLLKFSSIEERLPEQEDKVLIRAPAYYLNNRQIFVNFISSLFAPYKKELLEKENNYSCEKSSSEFSLLIHQKIVRDYLNLYTPYRGLLLYHGLGSGKTCSSIAIAEGFKSDKLIYVMTPASLRVNYIEELKKCGDLLFRKNQYWEFIDTKTNPDLQEALSFALQLSKKFIKDNGGAWMVNRKVKNSNFDKLSSSQQITLDKQLNEMIKNKYKFINYNGLRMSHLNTLTINNTVNPFNNNVVIIDEAHNLVSRIVNKIERDKKKGEPTTIATKLYNLLMSAENCRIVLLSGTPIINYPNEIGIMMNILRGKIKIWKMKLSISEQRKISQETLIKLFKSYSISNDILDYLQYKSTTNILTITRNPFGFFSYNLTGKPNGSVKEYEGVTIGEDGNVSDNDFIEIITRILNDNNIKIVSKSIEIDTFNCLPDTLENFSSFFLSSDNSDSKKESTLKNMKLFKNRIIGLTSYFPDIEELLPKYNKSMNFYIKKIEMSEFQFSVYEEARKNERTVESNRAKKQKMKAGSDIFEESSSTYRIFSRAFCNFVFPKPDILRPMPKDSNELSTIINETVDENLLDAADELVRETKSKSKNDETEKEEKDEAEIELDELASEFSDVEREDISLSYEERIKDALKQLDENREKYLTPEKLTIYSPKFLNLLENILDPTYVGLHLMYTQFRTLEGIGIFSLILKANGFTQFKIKKDVEWQLDITPEEMGKPKFVLYTGTETPEEKEIIRNIFNGDWEFIPPSLKNEIEAISSNNIFGEIIKLIMITASGAEGISLKNVRYVHLTEPYWHPVRLEQVIGRARRICSHKDLPEDLQTVEVFLYLMTFSNTQLESSKSIELRLKDKSKIDNTTPLTSDEALYEISTLKENINKEILKNVKEAAIDCNIHSEIDDKNDLKCFTFGSVNTDKFSYVPSISQEESDTISDINKTSEEVNAREVTIPEIGTVAFDKNTGKVYDLDSYKRKNPIEIGTLTQTFNEAKNKNEYTFTRL